ncbi:hypothetical protein [Pseudomonas sp. EA_105y_Pfl2_R69]|uniref:hypothetical protein n=1 Tax=Pseudomonas sp. EA_105y_Pfl2_R69 TaxID=3088683 RepID=UPI0030DB04A3
MSLNAWPKYFDLHGTFALPLSIRSETNRLAVERGLIDFVDADSRNEKIAQPAIKNWS